MKVIDDGIITKLEYEGLSFDEKVKYWQVKGNKFILISQMDDEHLQKAFCYAQKKELIYLNRHNLFNELVAQIENEARTKRGLKLDDLKTEFHQKRRKFTDKQEIGIREVGSSDSGPESNTV